MLVRDLGSVERLSVFHLDRPKCSRMAQSAREIADFQRFSELAITIFLKTHHLVISHSGRIPRGLPRFRFRIWVFDTALLAARVVHSPEEAL